MSLKEVVQSFDFVSLQKEKIEALCYVGQPGFGKIRCFRPCDGSTDNEMHQRRFQCHTF